MPFYTDPLVELYLGDCLEVMPTLADGSVDAVVTDPPYGLSFMGKHWDHGVPAQEFWGEMLRVAKPGAYLLAFGGTRTVHRIATNIEDAGWIIRDMLMWIYASGFPKGKANLKPAHEPIVLARKPGPLRPLGIEACLIPASDPQLAEKYRSVRNAPPRENAIYGQDKRERSDGRLEPRPGGRWPSNVLLDPDSAALFDEPNPWVVGSGATSGGGEAQIGGPPRTEFFGLAESSRDRSEAVMNYGDSGGYSRFFIIPKADRAERERGVERSDGTRGNSHPTVKSLDLMRHLVRLVTPPGGVILDPFLGSGTTCLAASEEGLKSIGIEREAEYLEIAKGRLMATPMGLGLDVPAGTKRPPKTHPDLSKHQPKHGGSGPGSWIRPGRTGLDDEEPAA